MEGNELKEYKYKTDKVERYFSFASLILFFVSFNGSSGFIVFTVFTVTVLAYYFKVYKNKPSYININGDEITVSQGLFFKLKSFRGFDMNTVEKFENRIDLKLKSGEKLVLMKVLLSDSDYTEIFNKLTRLKSGDIKE